MIFLLLSSGFSLCSTLFPPEKLSMQREDYYGNELRTDGYYYCQEPKGDTYEAKTLIMFFYRNGILFSPSAYWTLDLEIVEKQMVIQNEEQRKERVYWNVFTVVDNRIKYEGWANPATTMTIQKNSGYIENDTTFRITEQYFSHNETTYYTNDVWHFKKFSPKPDSTNNFIK